MCTATETLDLALSAERVDIAAAFADGTPMDPQADAKLDWTKACLHGRARGAQPQGRELLDIDGHRSTPRAPQPLAPSSCSTSAQRSTGPDCPGATTGR